MQKILNAVIELQAYSISLNDRIEKLRNELELIITPSPKKTKKSVLTEAQKAELIARRRKTILRAQNKMKSTNM